MGAVHLTTKLELKGAFFPTIILGFARIIMIMYLSRCESDYSIEHYHGRDGTGCY